MFEENDSKSFLFQNSTSSSSSKSSTKNSQRYTKPANPILKQLNNKSKINETYLESLLASSGATPITTPAVHHQQPSSLYHLHGYLNDQPETSPPSSPGSGLDNDDGSSDPTPSIDGRADTPSKLVKPLFNGKPSKQTSSKMLKQKLSNIKMMAPTENDNVEEGGQENFNDNVLSEATVLVKPSLPLLLNPDSLTFESCKKNLQIKRQQQPHHDSEEFQTIIALCKDKLATMQQQQQQQQLAQQQVQKNSYKNKSPQQTQYANNLSKAPPLPQTAQTSTTPMLQSQPGSTTTTTSTIAPPSLPQDQKPESLQNGSSRKQQTLKQPQASAQQVQAQQTPTTAPLSNVAPMTPLETRLDELDSKLTFFITKIIKIVQEMWSSAQNSEQLALRSLAFANETRQIVQAEFAQITRSMVKPMDNLVNINEEVRDPLMAQIKEMATMANTSFAVIMQTENDLIHTCSKSQEDRDHSSDINAVAEFLIKVSC